MNAIQTAKELERLHPSIWRASQLGKAVTRCVDTGFPTLSRQLPGGGWPIGTCTDLLVQQPGIGELRLLGPALTRVAARSVVMICPPQVPQISALAGLGVAPSQVIWIRSERTADSLWAAEQVLRSGSCGAVLFWQTHVRMESLRRLHLAAQQGETLFFMFRPMAAAQDTSPAPLRLSLRPARGGIEIGIVKRAGPQQDKPLFLPLPGPGIFQPAPLRNVEVEQPVQPVALQDTRLAIVQ